MKNNSVVLTVGGCPAVLPLMHDGRTPAVLCWLVLPFSAGRPTKLLFVEKINDSTVFAAECPGGRCRRFDRFDLSAASSPFVLVVSEGWSGVIRFYGAAVVGGYCAFHPGSSSGPLPSDLAGFKSASSSGVVDYWLLCPGSWAVGIWPIQDHSVEIRPVVDGRRSGPVVRLSAFDLWLVVHGFVGGAEALYSYDLPDSLL